MVAVAVWQLGGVARACAGLVHDGGDFAESDHAEVVFEVGDGEVSASYLAAYVGDAAAFGWVIPVPGDAAPRVEDGDPDLFDGLRAASAPRVEWGAPEASEGGCALGCLAGAKSGGDLARQGSTASNGPTLIDQGFTGTFDYVVLAGGDATELQAWLDDRGWSGLPAEDLQHYVDAGSVFVALAISPAIATTPAEGAPLPPVRLTYPGDVLRFPSVMARHAAGGLQRTTAYVVGDGRAALVEGWTSEDGGRLEAPGFDPEEAFLLRLGGLGDDRAWLRTWAGPFSVAGEARVATRFDTYAPTAVHDADAVFAIEDESGPIATVVDVSEPAEGRAAGLAAAAVLGGSWLRRRRQESRNSLPTEK